MSPPSTLLFFLALIQSMALNSLAFQPSISSAITHPPLFYKNQITTIQQPRHKATQKTQLSALPQTAWWAAGHAIGGAMPLPIIVNAINSWYRKIDLPSWTPPDRIFGPVWTTLYCCMGVAAAKIYRATKSTMTMSNNLPMQLWTIHCALNLSWAPIFFGMKRLRFGLWIQFSLLATLAAIIRLFYQIEPVSAYLLLPYSAWLTFATLLNWDICKRNPTKNGYNNAKLQSDLVKLQKDAATYAGCK